MARACELTVAAIRAAIVAWRKANLKPVSKMRVKELDRSAGGLSARVCRLGCPHRPHTLLNEPLRLC